MEKIIAVLWAPKAADRASFHARLRDQLVSALRDAGARHIRLNMPDDDVADGAALIQCAHDPMPDAVVQCWVASSNSLFRAPIDALLSWATSRWAAWLVTESVIIANNSHPAATGARTAGFAQMALLTKPARLDWAEWRSIWRDYHTKVAIETQSNFEYVQNLVVEPLTPDAPPYVAIVEECFPVTALRDPYVFFDATGDDAKFQANLATMMDSCDRFIDRGTIDVMPTSQYDFG